MSDEWISCPRCRGTGVVIDKVCWLCDGRGQVFLASRTPSSYRFKSLAEVATRDEQGNPHCPVCGGTQFKAKRSTGRKAWAVGLSPALLLLKANQVACVTCGTVFRRSTKPVGSNIWGSGPESARRLMVLVSVLVVLAAIALLVGAFSGH